MNTDSVIAEIRKIKDQIAVRFKFDAQQLGAALINEQEKSGRKIVRLKPDHAKTA